jgi:sulfur-carrier protein adenylyltransferase/sulfurtransferase
VNDACVIQKKPLVYGALHGFEGQVSVFNHDNGPTYRCLFPQMPKAQEVPNCNEHGVLGILPGIIGNLQALEAVKVITGIGEVLSGILLMYDALGQRIQRIKVPLDAKNLKITALSYTYALSCGQFMEEVPAEALRQHLDQENGFLLDVRTVAEYSEGHIPGAKNMPLSEVRERLGEVPTDAPVYVICQSGVRSAAAVEQLKDHLPQGRFINVMGGMNQLNTNADTRY